MSILKTKKHLKLAILFAYRITFFCITEIRTEPEFDFSISDYVLFLLDKFKTKVMPAFPDIFPEYPKLAPALIWDKEIWNHRAGQVSYLQ